MIFGYDSFLAHDLHCIYLAGVFLLHLEDLHAYDME